MFQILALEGVWFTLIYSLFGTVAKVYDILMGIVYSNGNLSFDTFESFTTAIYVLAGVFMLFRATIGLIQMLINPDQISDKNAGASKLIIRIVTSIIMLMVFRPDGLLFGKSGLFQEIEDALLLEEDSIMYNIMGEKIEDATASAVGNKKGNDKDADLVCYYMNAENAHLMSSGDSTKYEFDLKSFYKIKFYKNSSSGTTGKLNGGKYSYTVVTDELITNSSQYYSSFPGKISKGNVFTGNNFSCPKSFERKQATDGTTYYSANKNWPFGDNGFTKCLTGGGPGATECKNINGITGGYNNMNKFVKKLKEIRADNILTGHGKGAKINTEIDVVNDVVNSNNTFLAGVSVAAKKFARGVMGCFLDCSSGNTEECNEAKEGMLETVAGNQKVIKLVKSDTMNLDFFTAMIAGIGLVVYLLILCVDVIIRRLKLLLLEMIAPIPIISYVDPKDKIFGQWSKMYISTYVDLFIKLIAISLAITMLKGVTADFDDTTTPLLKFFYIVAILIFAKLVPSMISKIFGLDSMGGSFKDIGKMAKTAAGFGVGAAVGVGAGALAMGAGIATGKGARGKLAGGLQGLGSMGSGLFKGAGSGLKGKPLAGGSDILANAKKQRDAAASGSTLGGRMLSGISQKLNFDDPYEKAEKQYKAADSFLNNLSSSNDEALKVAKKAAGNGSQIDEMKNLREAQDAVAAYNTGGQTWTDFIEKNSSYKNMSSSELDSNLISAQKKATAKVQADALHFKEKGISMGDMGYVGVDMTDTIKIGKQVENLRDEARMLGQDFALDVDATGHATFKKNSELKDAKAVIEDMKTTAQGDMTRHKPDHDAVLRGKQ